jgi:hypothetical protein
MHSIKQRNSPKLAFNQALTSPNSFFAFWKKEELLITWQTQINEEDKPGFEFHLNNSLNNPHYILKSWHRWYLANVEDRDDLITVPWEDFDSWLRANGFTGKVDKKYIQTTDEYQERKSKRLAERKKRNIRVALCNAWNRQDTSTVRELFDSLWGE